MNRLLLAFAMAVLVTGSLSAAPRRDRPGTAITADNVNQLQLVGEYLREVWDLGWGPAPGDLAVLAWEKTVDVLDERTLTLGRTLLDKKRLVHFAFSRDREQLAWSVNGTEAGVENLRTGKRLEIDAGQSQPGLTFSPDGKYLATSGYGKQAKLWDLATGKVVRTYDTDTDGGLTTVFSPDGRLMALGNRNSDARIFEAATGKLLHTLPKRMSHELRFNPAGDKLAITYVDGEVKIWEPASGNLLESEKSGAQELYTLDWSPKGDLLVTAGREGSIAIWDPKGLKKLKELEMAQWVIRVRFSPDGDRLVAAGGTGNAGSPDRKLSVWSVPAR